MLINSKKIETVPLVKGLYFIKPLKKVGAIVVVLLKRHWRIITLTNDLFRGMNN